MAIKAGTENKRNVIIAGALFCILAFLGIRQLMDTSPTPAPAPVAKTQAPPPLRPNAIGTPAANTSGAAAKKVNIPGPGLGIDPSLHLDKLAMSESIEYAGLGRNIFSEEAPPPPPDEAALAAARPEPPSAFVPVLPPPPPQIDLHYFGYSADKDGKRQAFLLHGEDIFEAAAGEIVNHRYKVVAVDAHSVQVTDLSYNNTQTLPLVGN
jgi:hypothetical protein